MLVLLVMLASCSGGGGGGGRGGTGGITVIVSPGAALVQLNQTLQLTAAVTGAPSVNIATSNGAVRANNVVTITTTQPHGFTVGQVVTITGVTDTTFLGSFIIASVPSTTTLTYNQTGSDATSGGGSIPQNNVTWQVNGVAGGNAMTGTISATGLYTAPSALIPATTATITPTGASRMTNTVTITTTAAHGFNVGQVVSILGVTDPPPVMATITSSGAVRTSNVVTITTTAAHTFVAGQQVTISGVVDASFNGAFTISSVPSSTTFTFSQSAANASSGGGTASVPVTSFNGNFVIATVPTNTTFTYTQVAANATSGNGTVSSAAVQITAVSVANTAATDSASVGLDSGITLTLLPTAASLATGETVPFTATTSGTTTTGINWFVNDTAGGNPTVGTISATGLYMAPAAVPTPSTVTIRAQATADPTKVATATATISSSATTPTLTAVWPTRVAQGSGFVDFYLAGTNFLSTTLVRFGGMTVPGGATAPSSTLLRARIPESFFDAAGTFQVDVTTQSGGAPSASFPVMVTAERPALISTSPDSVTAGSPNVTVRYTGGYYASSVQAEFDGGLKASTLLTAAQRDVALSASDVGTAGMYSVAMRNPAAPQPIAAGNLAVQPTASPSVTMLSVPTGGMMPSAIAVNTVTGVAVVANQGSGDISRIDIGSATAIGAPIVVCGSTSSQPTGVAVDSLRNLAVVACRGNNMISIVDLAAGAVLVNLTSPTPTGASQLIPLSVAVSSETGIAIVANESTNRATAIDLTTNSLLAVISNVNTGTNAQVAIDTRLNWAVVTPGGSGTVSIVDLARQSAIVTGGAVRSSNTVTITTASAHSLAMGSFVTIAGVANASFNGTFEVVSAPTSTTFTYTQMGQPDATSGGGVVRHPGVLATVALGSNVRGISINSETHTALLADSTQIVQRVFSLLDQTVRSVTATTGFAAAAVNSLTNVGVLANFGFNTIQLMDQLQPALLGVPLGVGMGPRAVAIDPGTNTAVVANETSNDVTIVNLGAIRSPHIVEMSPRVTMTSSSNLTLEVVGFDLSGGTVRLDEVPLAATLTSARRITATVPAAMLSAARRYVVDVQTAGGVSNVAELTVIQPVTVGSAPVAVTIDSDRDVAVVTNSGDDTISLVDLNAGTAGTPITVGDNPQGVGVISRQGLAVVTNFAGNTASVVDINPASGTFGTVVRTVNVGNGPLGVAVNPSDGRAVVANSTSNTVTIFEASTGTVTSTTTVDQRPTAVAIDPVRGMAAVTNTTGNSTSFITISSGVIAGRAPGFQIPTGVVYDAESDRFVVASSLQNDLRLVNPDTFQLQAVRVGINPTSLAHNRHSSTLVTVNTASNTMSVMDFRGQRVREVMGIMGSPLFSVEIHPRTNLAVVVDTANNRLLLVPLPR
jgi:DNA-binding beta-propeller fold protein YncE